MSFPNIPDVDASVDISTENSVNLLLASFAFVELGLAHLINAEAEKIQYGLGTIEGQARLDPPPTLEELLLVNHSVDQTLRDIIKKKCCIGSVEMVRDGDNLIVTISTDSPYT
ncbi:MAG: hypothetical protein VB096_10400 [Pseudoflavonifractor sp.]|nr:hypothetical protein [Pseudoflavonifractor sp.]